MKIDVTARWAALLLGLVFAASALAQSGARSGVAVATDVVGTVFVEVGNGAPRLLQPGHAIPSGATLLAGAGANAVLRFADGQVVVIGERTAFRIVEYRYDPKDPGQSRDVLNVIAGSVRIIVGAIGERNPGLVRLHVGKGSIFPVSSRDGAQAGAAGITVERADTIVTVSQGQAYLSLANGNGILLTSGGGVYLQPSGNYRRGSADQIYTQLGETSYGKQLAGWLHTMESFEIAQRSPRMVITVTVPFPFEARSFLVPVTGSELVSGSELATGSVPTAETGASIGTFCAASCN